MIEFDSLPREAKILFNPAFCGELIYQAVLAYTKAANSFPYALSFLLLPIALHSRTRQLVSTRLRKPMHVWIQENQEVRIQFAGRCKDYLTITQNALEFLFGNSLLTINEDGTLSPVHRRSKRRTAREKANFEQLNGYFDVSNKLGKWFAEAGDPGNVFTMWGVRP